MTEAAVAHAEGWPAITAAGGGPLGGERGATVKHHPGACRWIPTLFMRPWRTPTFRQAYRVHVCSSGSGIFSFPFTNIFFPFLLSP